jgi:hypothetical protein
VDEALICTPPLGEVVGSLPDQPSPALPPEAVQDVAPLTAHFSVMVPPAVTVDGEALNAVLNTGGVGVVPVTVTEADWAVLPPVPAQLST